MPNVINVDTFLAALDSYDWRNVQPNNRGRLNASSPFGLREDKTPSFSVIIDPDRDDFGCWRDAGAKDPEWARGGPVKLYAFLRNITYEEAREELTTGEVAETGPPKLRVKLKPPSLPERPKPIDVSAYVAEEVPYLTERGISPEVQRMFNCGFDGAKNAVVMPWHDPAGVTINAKWRATWSKAFWYAKGGAPVRNMIYGIHLVYARGIKRVIITESETDAMYLWSCGFPAVAVGGSTLTDNQAEMLRMSPASEIVIGTDNDAAGEKLREEIAAKMRGYCAVYDVRWPGGAKDANEVRGVSAIEATVKAATRRNIFMRLQHSIAAYRRIM
ncbi:toprim domain-containing protein [Paenibacillus sp. FSL W8-0426]|uniref:toprim domain-containing protein n=1 Tax=Paenibacillus sp. FSL W8-0426 TaxID=2921714 RepID=UPI0030D8B204